LGIASILYLRGEKSAELLSDYTLKEATANPLTTDMHILSEISKNEKEYFQLLPTVPGNRNVLPDAPLEFIRQSNKALELFNCYFDGGDLGRYLFGDDPRNWGGRPPIRHNPRITYYHVRSLFFYIDSTRKFPSIAEGEFGNLLPIHALHIHSKELKLFNNNKLTNRIKKAVRNSQKPTRNRFFPNHFLRGTVHRFGVRK
jgi:hypothetical protein